MDNIVCVCVCVRVCVCVCVCVATEDVAGSALLSSEANCVKKNTLYVLAHKGYWDMNAGHLFNWTVICCK